MNRRSVGTRRSREHERTMDYLAIDACRQGRFAGFRLISDEHQPEYLRGREFVRLEKQGVTREEYASWKAGWQETKRKAEEEKHQTGTIVWISMGDYRGHYGVVTGQHTFDNAVAIVTLWAPPLGETTFVHFEYLETDETLSIRDTWNPPEEILLLSNATERGPVQLTWEQVLDRADIVGGDIESVEDGVVFRGPIKAITVRDGTVVIESEWMARLDPSTREWNKWSVNRLVTRSEEAVPQNIGEGRVHFTMSLLGSATIFPKGGSKLDPSRVKGLNIQN